MKGGESNYNDPEEVEGEVLNIRRPQGPGSHTAEKGYSDVITSRRRAPHEDEDDDDDDDEGVKDDKERRLFFVLLCMTNVE